MTKDSKGILFLICFFIIILASTKLANHYVDKFMYKKEINFIISKIEISPALRCSFYNSKGQELKAYGFTFYANCDIEIGDKIVKKANSSELLIYRKDAQGEYKFLKKQNPH